MGKFQHEAIRFHFNDLEKKGDVHPGHSHKYTHSMLVPMGRVKVIRELDGDTREDVLGPDSFPFEVKAGIKHTIIALEDHCRFWCIMCAHDPRTGKPVPYWNGNEGAFE